MAKIVMELESRAIPISQNEKDVAELFELTGMCEFNDDAESDNDFDVYLRSDYDRQATTVDNATNGQVSSDQRASYIPATRVDDSQISRDNGSWVVDSLKGYRVWCYHFLTPEIGTWHVVLSNTANTITVKSGTIFATANRIQLQAQSKLRHHIQLNSKCDFYGSFFQYRVVKNISNVDGVFKWFGVKGTALPRNVDSEFFTASGDVTNGWES